MNQNTDAREQAEAGPGAATVPAQAAGGQAKTGGEPARHDGGPAADRQTDRDRRGRRGWVVAGVVVVVAAGAIGAALATGAFRGSGNPAAVASSGYKTGTATVTRQSLTSQTQENATLGDAGTWSCGGAAQFVVLVFVLRSPSFGVSRRVGDVHLAAADRAGDPPGPADLRRVRQPGGAAVRLGAGLP